jgi:hypothetical protein
MQPVDWSVYMDYAAITKNVKDWVEAHPNIARLNSLGQSYEGRDIWLVTITNRRTGDPKDKPGIYVQGGIDSDEVITVQSPMYLMHRVLSAYGNDPAITRLVDTRTLYIAPNIIPDQSENFWHSPKRPRDSTTQPYDNDTDGLLDEDDQDDIDGDGQILQMRVEDPQGDRKVDPNDSRLMVSRLPSDGPEAGPFYRVYSREGIDNDGDGRINEDPVGGVDANRNWPSDWVPEYQQSWAGPYPLSEIENKHIMEFLLDNPNIGMDVELHSTGNFLYRPSSIYPDEEMDPTDLAFYNAFGRRYTHFTDGDVRTPISYMPHGGMMDSTYQHLGIFGFAPELWAFPVDENGLENRDATASERLDWAIENLGEEVWNDWKPFDHPELGKVEIGGWAKPMPNNPVGEHVERISKEIGEWMIFLWAQLPLIEVDEVKVDPIDVKTYKVEMTVTNTGFVSTNVTERAVIVGKAQPVFLAAKADEGINIVGLVGGPQEHRKGMKGITLGHLGGWGSARARSSRPTSATVSLLVVDERPNRNSSASLEVVVDGERAGTVRRTIELKE